MSRAGTRGVILAMWAMASFATITIAFQADPPKALPPVPKGFPREEEDPLSPGLVKPIELDDDAGDVMAGKGAVFYRIRAIASRVAATKDESLRQFYKSYSVAYDRLNEPDGKKTRILPLSKHREQRYPLRFGAYTLSADNKPSTEIRAFELGKVLAIRHFEEIVIDQARELTKQPTDILPALSASQRAEIAETLMLEALFFHGWAVDQGKRKGGGWDGVRKAVAEELAVIRGKRLKQAVADKDWALARVLGTRLIDAYGNTPERLEEVYLARLAEAEAVLEAANDRASELERVYLAVGEYEARSPNPDRKRIAAIREKLTEASKRRYERADQLQLTDKGEAGRLVTEARSFDPGNVKVQELSSILAIDYSVLGIGVTRMPERMTPTMARFDSERLAAGLIFEPLLEPIPDDQLGTLFRPVLALHRTDVTANSRTATIDRAAIWTGDRVGLDVADVRGTIDLLRKARETWPGYITEWIADVRADDPTKVRIGFKRGHFDPRTLLGFPVLPARWLQSQNKTADDLAFASRPFGTGPFVLADPTRPGEALFRANVQYGLRPDRPAQPNIKEIRLVNLNEVRNPLAEMQADRIHILPDIATAEAERFRNQRTQSGRTLNIVTSRDNRRMSILAINHRNLMLRDPNLRRGLMHAIDREAILEDVYRARGSVEMPHVALTGPFLPNSWVAPKPQSIPGSTVTTVKPLLNRDLATAKFAEFLKSNGTRGLTILVPADEPLTRKAAEVIKKQVEELAKDEGSSLTMKVEPVPPADFFRRTLEEHTYELALTTFDYPDDILPLGLAGLLDPSAANRNGRNFLGYLVTSPTAIPTDADRTLGKLLAEVQLYRDPERIVSISKDIHSRFNECVPFVPLWQLDRHMVISSAVKPFTDESITKPLSPRSLDPNRILKNVSRWRVE